MNPISAIRQFVMPEARPAAVVKAMSDSTVAGAVPFNELQKLGPGALQQPFSSQPAGGSFGDLLGQMVNEVGAKQTAAGDAIGGVLSGQGVPLHQAMIAMQEASVSFQLMVEVRNKLLESYQELMRMQI
ncbi:MAG: flagellar hook-basal body complex protein FliE [Verrucomicrobiota bacterium]